MALETEIDVYEKERPNLLPQEGRFALVYGAAVRGTFDSYQDALQAGYDAVGLGPFLVKKIEMIEQVQMFTRDLNSCRT